MEQIEWLIPLQSIAWHILGYPLRRRLSAVWLFDFLWACQLPCLQSLKFGKRNEMTELETTQRSLYFCWETMYRRRFSGIPQIPDPPIRILSPALRQDKASSMVLQTLLREVWLKWGVEGRLKSDFENSLVNIGELIVNFMLRYRGREFDLGWSLNLFLN